MRVQIFFLVVMLPIVIADLRNHVIPNIYLKFLAACLCFSWLIRGIPQPKFVALSLLIAGLLVIAKFGMGDVKLLVILLLTFQPQIVDFCGLLAIFSITHIVISTAQNRLIPVSIPLAPAIFSALATYLATR